MRVAFWDLYHDCRAAIDIAYLRFTSMPSVIFLGNVLTVAFLVIAVASFFVV